MPWTFAHPAAVLPLRRLADAGHLSFPALLMGCITPDVVYHIGFWNLGRLTHSPLGVVLVDVPAGLLLLVCCAWLKSPVAALLPEPHRSVLMRVRGVHGWCGFGVMVLSLAMGAGTHLLWDGLTHQDAFFVRAFEWLGWPVRALAHEVRVFKLLQHGGTLVGLFALAMAYRRHVRQFVGLGANTVRELPARGYGTLAWTAIVAFVLAFPLALGAAADAGGELNLQILLVRQVAYTTTSFVLLLSAIAIVLQRRS